MLAIRRLATSIAELNESMLFICVINQSELEYQIWEVSFRVYQRMRTIRLIHEWFSFHKSTGPTQEDSTELFGCYVSVMICSCTCVIVRSLSVFCLGQYLRAPDHEYCAASYWIFSRLLCRCNAVNCKHVNFVCLCPSIIRFLATLSSLTFPNSSYSKEILVNSYISIMTSSFFVSLSDSTTSQSVSELEAWNWRATRWITALAIITFSDVLCRYTFSFRRLRQRSSWNWHVDSNSLLNPSGNLSSCHSRSYWTKIPAWSTCRTCICDSRHASNSSVQWCHQYEWSRGESSDHAAAPRHSKSCFRQRSATRAWGHNQTHPHTIPSWKTYVTIPRKSAAIEWCTIRNDFSLCSLLSIDASLRCVCWYLLRSDVGTSCRSSTWVADFDDSFRRDTRVTCWQVLGPYFSTEYSFTAGQSNTTNDPEVHEQQN